MDLRPYNMVLSNYEGKTGQPICAIQLDVIVGSITRPIIFMVIEQKASYNLLLGREWIHGIWVVHSSLHQRITIWWNTIIVQNVEEDQGYYMEEVNHVDKRNFDKNLANIARCTTAGFTCMPLEEEFYSNSTQPMDLCGTKSLWVRGILTSSD